MASPCDRFCLPLPKFDELAANNVCDMLELDSADAVEFLAIQRGFLSLEAACRHFAFEPDDGDEDYQAATLNIESSAYVSPLSLEASKSVTRSSAICAPSRPLVSTNKTQLDPCGELALSYKRSRPPTLQSNLIMPAGSPKKLRKKPKAPQVIAPELWVAIEKACCGGLGYSECARKFGVSVFAIMARARRNKWPVGSRIQRRVEALQEARYKARERYTPYEEQRNSNAQVTEAIAESWAEKGERHRALAFDLAHNSLRKVAKIGLPIENWKDADLADKAARRNAGLDSEEGNRIQIGLALIETRLQAINLPKDALPE